MNTSTHNRKVEIHMDGDDDNDRFSPLQCSPEYSIFLSFNELTRCFLIGIPVPLKKSGTLGQDDIPFVCPEQIKIESLIAL